MKNTAPAPRSAFTHPLRQRAHQWAGTSAQTVSEGLESAPTAFVEMMRGKNIGKQVVKVA